MLAEERHPGRVAEPFVGGRGVDDVAEEERDGAVGGGLRGEVGVFGLDGGGDGVDGGQRVAGANALEFELLGDDAGPANGAWRRCGL